MKKSTLCILAAITLVMIVMDQITRADGSWGGFDTSGALQTLIAIGFVVWIIGLVTLLSRRDIDIHDKLTWVVVILLLYAIGAVLYFFFGPRHDAYNARPSPLPPDAEPTTPEGESWNPIQGTNPMPPKSGLNG